jgi:hypothetical protein
MPDIRPPATSSALVLNATYEPLGVVSVRRAAILILSAKAVCIANGDGILHSERTCVPIPLVVRLTRFVGFHTGRTSACPGARSSRATVGGARTAGLTPRRSTTSCPAVAAVATYGRTLSPPAPGVTTPKVTKRQPKSVGVCMSCPPRPRVWPGGYWGTGLPTRAGPSGSTPPPDADWRLTGEVAPCPALPCPALCSPVSVHHL